MKKKLLYIMLFILLATSLFSNNCLATGDIATEGAASTLPDTSSTAVPVVDEVYADEVWWQVGISKFLLAIGDFFDHLITDLVGQNYLTIQDFIFGHVEDVDANFFTDNGSTKGVLKGQINDWFIVFRRLAISFYAAGLLVVGIRCLLEDTPISRAKAKDVASKWLTGLAILFLFPYVMKYTFLLNADIVARIEDGFTTGHQTGTYIGSEDEFSLEDLEFRSPEYRSKYTGILTYGGDELNKAYLRRLNDFTNTADMMRVMRAYAGVTKRVIFCIIWYILLFQLVIILVKYYKRYFVIALLIAIFPGVTIFYLLDSLKGKTCAAFSAWCREFFVNVFTQTVHAIIYAIIAGVCIDRVRTELTTSNTSTMNWLIIIVSINFLFQGEKIVRKIMGVNGSSTATALGDSTKRGREGVRKARGFRKEVMGMFRR